LHRVGERVFVVLLRRTVDIEVPICGGPGAELAALRAQLDGAAGDELDVGPSVDLEVSGGPQRDCVGTELGRVRPRLHHRRSARPRESEAPLGARTTEVEVRVEPACRAVDVYPFGALLVLEDHSVEAPGLNRVLRMVAAGHEARRRG